MEEKGMDPIEKELEEIRKLLLEDEFIPDTDMFEECTLESYVRISEDGMEAWLYLKEPKEEIYTKESLISLLAENGVVYGLNGSNIAAMVKKKVYEREIKIAEGFPAIPGRDGYYEYFFTPENLFKQPTIRDDGSVDYMSMSSLQNIKEGEQVARYHPAVYGEDGCNVRGEVIKSDVMKEMHPLLGRGIAMDEESHIYYATVNGKIESKDGRIDIQTVHELNGDVDLVIGKVEFYGDIVINGNVGAGVVIRAGRNITITGTVENCRLEAGGDIVLQRGIQGAEKATIVAQGNVYAEFIEFSRVKAGGSVQANAIMNSTIYAGEQVKVSGKRGVIMGGYVHGLCGVEAQQLGNDAEVKTVVHAGFLPDNYEKYLELKKMEIPAKEKLADVVRNMVTLIKRCKKKKTEQDVIRLESLNIQKDELRTALEKIVTEKEKYQAEIDKGGSAFILIKGTISRGSVISMEDARMPILKQDSFKKYTVNCGAIDGQIIAI